MSTNPWNGKFGYRTITITFLLGMILILSCAKIRNTDIPSVIFNYNYKDFNSLAMRFAPKFYLNSNEPGKLITVIPVHHPEKPIIAYHIFFDDDALFSGRGKVNDHEVLWVEYDPISYIVVDVPVLWHRTVIRTDSCLLNAKSSDQRPRVMVEWGLHGLLPLGWDKLSILRVNAEIRLHWILTKNVSKMPGVQKNKVSFDGTFEEFITFNDYVDTREFIKSQNVIVAEFSFEELKKRIDDSFALKKEWPDW